MPASSLETLYKDTMLEAQSKYISPINKVLNSAFRSRVKGAIRDKRPHFKSGSHIKMRKIEKHTHCGKLNVTSRKAKNQSEEHLPEDIKAKNNIFLGASEQGNLPETWSGH